jgi:predicted GNAT family N-acyltransferase
MSDAPYSWSGKFNDLNPNDQRAVAELVVLGRAVVGTVVDVLARLKRTHSITVLRESVTNRIVAVAALKQPVSNYRRDNFTKAGVPFAGFETSRELGYVVISPDMRGKRLSGDLVKAIVEQIASPTFATTDNKIMQNNLARSGFTRVGDEWQGKKGLLSLWIITP